MAIVNARLRTTNVEILDPNQDNAPPFTGAVPQGKSYAITNILVCNNDASASAQFDLHLVPRGEALDNLTTRVVNNLVLPAGETFTFDTEKIVLEEGDKVVFISQPEDVPAPVVATSIQQGKYYEISTTGTTNFTLIGAADNNPGTIFLATASGTGTGTATLSGYTNLSATISYLEV